MSYSATIGFKTLGQADIYPFFQKLKERVSNSLDEIANDNFLYMPSIRYKHLYKDVREVVAKDADEAWARNVFTMRFFYLAEHELLGVFGVPTSAEELFDGTIYFQNSCDQDYEFEEWEGVPAFARIADKWKNASVEFVKAKYTAEIYGEWDEDEEPDIDYYRRTFAYDEIWGMCEKYIWHDELAVHLALFGHYDLVPLMRFVGLCRKHYEKEFGRKFDD